MSVMRRTTIVSYNIEVKDSFINFSIANKYHFVKLKKIRDYRHVYATKSSDNLSESALDGILNIRHLISMYFTLFFYILFVAIRTKE